MAPSITIAALDAVPADADLAILPVFEDAGLDPHALALDRSVGGRGKGLIAAGSLRGEAKEVREILGERPAVLYLGLGKRSALTLEGVRRAAGVAAGRCRDLGARRVAVALPTGGEEKSPPAVRPVDLARALMDGIGLAQYRYRKEAKDQPTGDEKRPPVESLTLVVPPASREVVPALEAESAFARAVIDGVTLAREIANLPPNRATPRRIVDRTRAVAERRGLGMEVVDRARMEELGMGGILGVAQGSNEPPFLVALDWRPAAARETVAIVGKGVTFDSGGISIKPSEKMEEMKYDKSGAAATIGILDTVAALGLPIRVVGVIALTENLPSGTALKPADVLKAMDGTTIEIISTDAEGRLILADALAYARRFDPAAIVDLATLTGACVVALGQVRSGLFATDDGLAETLFAAGERSGDRLWRLPLDDDYLTYIESDAADLKNSGGRFGGAVTAAKLLQRFAGATPWAHLDIAGTAWDAKNKDYIGKGATGAGVRVVCEWLRGRAGRVP